MSNFQPVSCTDGGLHIPGAGRRSRPSGIALEAITERFFDGAARLLRAIPAWYERARQRRHLMALDDRLLRDIGISRAEALREFDKPFWRA